MNVIDLISIIPIALFALMGFKKGIVKELFGLLALFAGIICALQFSHLALLRITDIKTISSPFLPLIIYALVFGATFIVVIAIGRLVENVLKAAQLNIGNKLAGAALGILKALFILSFFVWLIDLANLFSPFIKKESVAYNYIKDITPAVISSIGEIIPWLKELITNIEGYFKEIASNIDRLN